jgi:cytochrome P450
MPLLAKYVPFFGHRLLMGEYFNSGKDITVGLFYTTSIGKDAYVYQDAEAPTVLFRKYEHADILLNAGADIVTKPNDESFDLLRVLGPGKCVLFMETTEEWSKKRASVMKAFSFENLKGMTNIMKNASIQLIDDVVKDGALKQDTFDIAPYLVSLSSSIVCESGFGEGTGKILLDFHTAGQPIQQKSIGAIIKSLSFNAMSEGASRIGPIFFPYLATIFKFKFKRETY